MLSFPTWPRPKGAAARLPAFPFPAREGLCVLQSGSLSARACWRLTYRALWLGQPDSSGIGGRARETSEGGRTGGGGPGPSPRAGEASQGRR